jgi:hypothetical protein
MNKKIVGILICLLLTLTSIVPLSGETNNLGLLLSGEVLDQKQEKSDDCLVIHDEWQEFKPTMNNLVRVEVKAAQWHNSSINCKLTIEKPLGNVLTQKSLPCGAFQYGVCGWVSFNVPDISLISGQSYFIRLVGTNGSDYGWSIGWSNPYSQGGSSKSGGDWCFRTFAEESGDHYPTVSIIYPEDGDIVKDKIKILGVVGCMLMVQILGVLTGIPEV